MSIYLRQHVIGLIKVNSGLDKLVGSCLVGRCGTKLCANSTTRLALLAKQYSDTNAHIQRDGAEI